jgi:Flp pilus assembly protein TadD
MALRSRPAFLARLLASAAALGLLSVAVAGCVTTGSSDTTGSIAASAAPRDEAEWRRENAEWAERYRVSPQDPVVAIRYAQTLRATGQRAQAVAVLEQAALVHSKNSELLGAYGRALADVGNYTQALEVLNRAHTPDQPDWRILSAEGAVLDEIGRHDEAERYYQSALKIAPDEPSVLSNLGLSYALAKNLPKAEETLRRAAAQRNADPRIRQNLALVVGLQGRFDEAESIARADLPPEDAAANVAYLRQMLSQPDDWKKLGGPPSRPARPRPPRLSQAQPL